MPQGVSNFAVPLSLAVQPGEKVVEMKVGLATHQTGYILLER